MLDEIGYFQGMFLEKTKLKTLHNLIQFPASPLPHKVDCHSTVSNGRHICTMHSIANFVHFFTHIRCAINQTSYMILTKSQLLQEVYLSHPKSE